MNKGIRFTEEFKQDAVAQVVERGYAIREVDERLGDQHQVIVHVDRQKLKGDARWPIQVR